MAPAITGASKEMDPAPQRRAPGHILSSKLTSMVRMKRALGIRKYQVNPKQRNIISPEEAKSAFGLSRIQFAGG